MKSRSVNSGARRIFVLVLDAVEDAFQTIADFADQGKTSSARQSRPSARSPKSRSAGLIWGAKQYRPIIVNEHAKS